MKPTGIDLMILERDEGLTGNDSLKAYVKIVLDRQFVVRDIRVVAPDDSGLLFLAFPSRKRGVRCRNRDCRSAVDPGDNFCSRCGTAQVRTNARDAFIGHRDCCFPVNSQMRIEIEEPVVEAYHMALAHPNLNTFALEGCQVQVDRKVLRDYGASHRSNIDG